MELNAKVLVINKQWQGYEEVAVQTALCDIFRGAATAIDTGNMIPVTWDEWVKLPVREGNRAIQTLHGPVRLPTVICKAKYSEMPKRRPKWSKRGVGKRDKFVCQITGAFAPDGNVDHVTPRSRGGRDAWTNTVWVDRGVNAKKADKTLSELGWKLLRHPREPGDVPMIRLIQPRHPDWSMFLVSK